MKKSRLFLALLLFVNIGLFGQNKKAFKLLQKAKTEISLGNEEKAIELAQKAIEKDPEYAEAYEFIGDYYAFKEDFMQAISLYKTGVSYSQKPHLLYKLGVVAMKVLDYDLAEQSFKNYINHPNAYQKTIIRIQNKILPDIAFGRNAVKNPVPFEPINLGDSVNLQDMQYFPSISADGQTLVYTSRNYEGKYSNEDFFETNRDSLDQWGTGKRLKGFLNTPGNEGAQCLSADGKILFFTGCDYERSRGSCDIYYSLKMPDGRWSKARNIGDSINTRAWESQPSISPDGKTLYFVRGKNSKADNINIYFSVLGTNGYWSKAKPIPGMVNTPDIEETPFIHFDNQSLYFSSNGHPGMGGKDLFVSRKQPDGSWGEPKNLGFPINSINDDFSLIVSPNGKTGYFSSDRGNETGYMDLFQFDLYNEIQATPVAWVKGIITDSLNQAPLSANLVFSDLKTGKVYQIQKSNKRGEYFAVLPANSDFGLTIEKESYLFFSENFALVEHPESKAFKLNAQLQPISEGANIVLKNIFYETDKFTLTQESYPELDRVVGFLKQNPTVSILIEGHTDNQGSSSYNLKLSSNRANAVRSYILKKGISPERVKSKGFGDKKPLNDNSNDEERRLNRRTEIKIIEI